MFDRSTKPGPVSRDVKSFLEPPQFEKSADEVKRSVEDLIKHSQSVVKAVGSQDLSKVTFSSTLGALDDLSHIETTIMNRIHFLQNVSTDEALRQAAQAAEIEWQHWTVEKQYDEGVYKAVKAYAQKIDLSGPQGEKLFGEDRKYLEEILRDYRRMGLELSKPEQEKLKTLQKSLSSLETEFSKHINDYEDEVWVDASELEGMDSTFIEHLKKNERGQVRISLDYPEYHPVMEFAKSESLRKQLQIKKYNTARATNVELLNRMIALRDEIASLLGYDSWNAYVIEERMAKTPKRVTDFLKDFEAKLKIKAKAELEILRKLKAEETKNANTEIHSWDFAYYSALYKKRAFQVDTQSMREFFPLDYVLQGMFSIVSKVFSLKFHEEPDGSYYKWADDIRLYKVSDLEGEALGYFYLDLFPRAGKYGHAAAFTLISGKYLPDGRYQRPVDAMVCNFSKQGESLLSHGEVETLFHEFGHVLHTLLTRAKFTRFAGTHVAWDFVEAPSQIMENWVWDYEMLQMISKHTKDPSKKISKDLVQKMNEAKRAGIGMMYLRQLSFARADLEFHSRGRQKDSTDIINRISREIFLPPPPDTTFQAGWGHMVGYASGYYGYAWADVIAADLFSGFRQKGLLNAELGLKLRREIFESGSSRDENESIEAFLGRPMSHTAFFQDLGLGT